MPETKETPGTPRYVDEFTPTELDDLEHDTVIAIKNGEFNGRQVDRIAEAIAARRAAQTPAGKTTRRGTVNRWNDGEPFGFITEDPPGGRPWFLPCNSLPAGIERLPKGTRVTFTGDPRPAPGRKHPTARDAELEPPREV